MSGQEDDPLTATRRTRRTSRPLTPDVMPPLWEQRPGHSVLWLPVSFVQELVETAVLVHFEVVQAKSALVEGSVGLHPKSGLDDCDAIAAVLSGLAYDLRATDSWLRLGITPLSGQRPSEALVEQRTRLA